VDVPITPAEVGIAARVGAKIAGWLLPGRKDHVARLKHNEAMRAALREQMALNENNEVPEIVVVRLGKDRKYGEADKRLLPLGASPWNKFEVKGIQDQGLEEPGARVGG